MNGENGHVINVDFMFSGKLSKTVKVVCCITKEGLGIADIWRTMDPRLQSFDDMEYSKGSWEDLRACSPV